MPRLVSLVLSILSPKSRRKTKVERGAEMERDVIEKRQNFRRETCRAKRDRWRAKIDKGINSMARDRKKKC